MNVATRFIVCALACAVPVFAMAADKLRSIDQAVEFAPQGGEKRWLRGVAVPTDSNFFIYEGGYAYMSHVERSQDRLRRVDFIDGRFGLVPYGAKLGKDLKCSLTAINALIYRDNDALRAQNRPGEKVLFRSEAIEGCGKIDYFATLDQDRQVATPDGIDVVVPNRGVFNISANEHVENVSCPDERTILLGTLSCGMSGYCGQVLVGVSLDAGE